MAYSKAWNESQPLGSAPADTLDTIIQDVKISLRERIEQFAPDFGNDSVDPKKIKVTADTTANMPATPDFDGDIYWSTDDDKLFIGDGGAWTEVSPAPTITDAVETVTDGISRLLYDDDLAPGTKAFIPATDRYFAVDFFVHANPSGHTDIDFSEPGWISLGLSLINLAGAVLTSRSFDSPIDAQVTVRWSVLDATTLRVFHEGSINPTGPKLQISGFLWFS